VTASGYVAIARPSHWFKNLLVLPGVVAAAFFSGAPPSALALPSLLALASACLVASANYVLNEWLDAAFDRHHPLKRSRPSVQGTLRRHWVYLEYAVLAALGLALAAATGSSGVLLASAAFLAMGVVYNVEPLRTKDRVHLDVLSESVNNPIRLLIGWYAVVDAPFPPSSLVVGYWTLGAYLMAVKRFAELRLLGPGEASSRYRRSFRFYSEESLLIAAFFYACCTSFLFAVFLLKYRVELLLCLPLLALAFAWYLRIGMRADSPAQRPERLYTEWRFALFLVGVAAFVLLLLLIDLPPLRWFLEPTFDAAGLRGAGGAAP
jgi:4-hydroxybenzoate polyprenyltransferase